MQQDSGLAVRIADAVERLGNAQRRLVQDVATRHALSPLQVQVLNALAAGPPPAARGSALAREWGLSQPTVSDAVASLQAKGLLVRVADPTDRRATALELTEEGRRTAVRLRAPVETIADAVGLLPQGEQEETLLALLRLIGVLADAGVVSAARTCLTCRFRERAPGGDRCGLLGVELPVRALRVNCPEHEAAAAAP